MSYLIPLGKCVELSRLLKGGYQHNLHILLTIYLLRCLSARPCHRCTDELVPTLFPYLYKVTNIEYFHIEIRRQILLSTLEIAILDCYP